MTDEPKDAVPTSISEALDKRGRAQVRHILRGRRDGMELTLAQELLGLGNGPTRLDLLLRLHEIDVAEEQGTRLVRATWALAAGTVALVLATIALIVVTVNA